MLLCLRLLLHKDVWETAIGEMVVCERESDNTSDRWNMAVKNKEIFASETNVSMFAVPSMRCYIAYTVTGLFIHCKIFQRFNYSL